MWFPEQGWLIQTGVAARNLLSVIFLLLFMSTGTVQRPSIPRVCKLETNFYSRAEDTELGNTTSVSWDRAAKQEGCHQAPESLLNLDARIHSISGVASDLLFVLDSNCNFQKFLLVQIPICQHVINQTPTECQVLASHMHEEYNVLQQCSKGVFPNHIYEI